MERLFAKMYLIDRSTIPKIIYQHQQSEAFKFCDISADSIVIENQYRIELQHLYSNPDRKP